MADHGMIQLTLHLLVQPFVQFATFSGRARRTEFLLFILSLLVIVNVTSLLKESMLRQGNGPHKLAYVEEGLLDGALFALSPNVGLALCESAPRNSIAKNNCQDRER